MSGALGPLVMVGTWVFVILLIWRRARRSEAAPTFDWPVLTAGVVLILLGAYGVWRYAVGAEESLGTAAYCLMCGAFAMGWFIWHLRQSRP